MPCTGGLPALTKPRQHVESFLVTSWAEYERLRGRATVSDGPALAERMHSGEGPPEVHRYLGHHHWHRRSL